MISHSDREHSEWSASSTERNWNCPGTLALTSGMPDTISKASDWGTVCHQVAEKCLNSVSMPRHFIGEKLKGKKYEFTFDQEMAETTTVFVDYVRNAFHAAVDASVPPRKTYTPRDFLLVEQRFSLSPLKPPFEAGGTADAVIYHPAEKTVEVVDLKGGRGVVVGAIGNKQLRMYALGVMLTLPAWKVDTIKVTIVQPRADHEDGRIRSEPFSVAELMEWSGDLLAAMHRAKEASRAYADKDMPRKEWAEKYLSAGSHCVFCKASAICPALAKRALDTIGVCPDDQVKAKVSTDFHLLDGDALAAKLDMLDMISGWIKALRAYAFAKAESGMEIPGYALVPSIGNRKLKEGAEEAFTAILKGYGIEPYKHTIISAAQAEAAGGGHLKEAIADLFERPLTGYNLVSENKTSRKSVEPPGGSERFFGIIE